MWEHQRHQSPCSNEQRGMALGPKWQCHAVPANQWSSVAGGGQTTLVSVFPPPVNYCTMVKVDGDTPHLIVIFGVDEDVVDAASSRQPVCCFQHIQDSLAQRVGDGGRVYSSPVTSCTSYDGSRRLLYQVTVPVQCTYIRRTHMSRCTPLLSIQNNLCTYLRNHRALQHTRLHATERCQ